MYNLNEEILGHSEDVRTIAVSNIDGSIVSGGRDKNAILWKNQNGNYIKNAVMTGHGNFVSSVCIIDPSEKYPEGLVVTGSNDNHICVYLPGETQPLHKFQAHENTVCCLRTSLVNSTSSFLSSSWDITAKLWDMSDLTRPQATFLGHGAAVWSVADMESGIVITGSADKTVIMHLRMGEILRKIQAHTDCVRDIVVINEATFLTCANDAVIKQWCAATGDSIAEFYGHTNYIYSMAAIKAGSLAVSCGEDKTVRVWRDGNLSQTISVPSETVWCVKILPNEDIVCGSSDGYIRIFTTDKKRFADPQVIKNYENAVLEKNASQALVGDLDVKKLQDASTALQQPGKCDGEVKVFSDKGIPKAYKWNQATMQWDLIGDVTGSKDASSKRQMYNGVEYDYVFSVDIQDGVPPLKLPYNLNQDPWHVAQSFIEKNDLPQSYLEQVANFIIKNSANAQQNSVPTTTAVAPSSQFYDPFTGGNRYIPAETANSASSQEAFKYVPMLDYLKLEQANLNAIRGKLVEFNKKTIVGIKKFTDEQLDNVVKLASANDCQEETIDVLMYILSNWPDDMVFPALDIVRLAVLYKNVHEKICTQQLMDSIEKHLNDCANAANKMLVYRLLANMFCHDKGEKLCLERMSLHIGFIKPMTTAGNKNNQVALSTYILNLAVAMNKANNNGFVKQRKENVLELINFTLQYVSEPEAVFRVLVGLGTLLVDPDNSVKAHLVQVLRQSENPLRILKTALENLDTQNKLSVVSREVSRLI